LLIGFLLPKARQEPGAAAAGLAVATPSPRTVVATTIAEAANLLIFIQASPLKHPLA
jgi:hypothetical protein